MEARSVSCDEVLEAYSELVDGRLPGSEAMRLWGHVRTCPSCGRYHKVVRGGVSVLRDLAEREAPSGFHERLSRRLAVEGSVRPRRTLADIVVLALVVALATVVWTRDRGPEVRATPAIPRVGVEVSIAPVRGFDWRSATATADPAALDPSPSPAYSPLVVGLPIHRAADWRLLMSSAGPVSSD